MNKRMKNATGTKGSKTAITGTAAPHLKDRGVKHIKISEAQKLYEMYDFKEEIGHGSFGVVVLAIEKANNKQWAIKIVHKNIAGAGKLLEVDREIKILKIVDHPNIIYLDKVYESPRKIYMVLELCKRELQQIYARQKPFSEKVCKKVILQLADAVSYLHKNDIVHRDIKMENILLADNAKDPSDEYFIKLTDFGLSIVKTGVGIQALMRDYCGTILYMPPEILQMKAYSELCDVWAIGIILYMMLYGRSPFFDKTDEGLTNKIVNEEPNYNAVEGVSPEAIDLMSGILKKDPVQRMTALQIKEHQWIDKKNKKATNNQNIVDMMKQFRHETVSSAQTPSRMVRGLNLALVAMSRVKSSIKISGQWKFGTMQGRWNPDTLITWSIVCDGIFDSHTSGTRLTKSGHQSSHTNL